MSPPRPIALWTALGANPTPLAFTEVYTALQQGTVDAQENPLELIYSQKFYEQQDYVVNTNHQIQPLFLVMNLDFYNHLPDDLRAVVDEGAAEYLKASRAYNEEMTETYTQTMVDYGCTFIDIERMLSMRCMKLPSLCVTIWLHSILISMGRSRPRLREHRAERRKSTRKG